MRNSLFFKVWMGLIMLTVVSAIISNANFNIVGILILILSIFKFIGIAFYFMELKKAHIFWKVSILAFLTLFSVISFSFL